MKRILFVTQFLIYSLATSAQFLDPDYEPKNLDMLRVESVLQLPHRDTVNLISPDTIGTIVFRPADNTVYIKKPGKWESLASGDGIAARWDSTTTKIKLGYVNVQWFGANPDGTGDNKAAIQAAVNSAPAVFFPAGTYSISGSILLNSATLIYGNNAVIRITSNGPAFVVNASGCQFTGMNFKGTGRGTMTNYATLYPNQHGISVSQNLYNLVVDRVSADSLGGAAVYAKKNTTGYIVPGLGGRITNSRFTNSMYGVYLDSLTEYFSTANCHISHNQYGFLNRGGNNSMIGGTLDSNRTAVFLDSTLNDGHSVFSGVTINHNIDYSIRARKIIGSFLFTGCQIFFGDIKLDTSRYIRLIGSTVKIDSIHLKKSDSLLVSGNLFFSPPYLDNVSSSTKWFDNTFMSGVPTVDMGNNLAYGLNVSGPVSVANYIKTNVPPTNIGASHYYLSNGNLRNTMGLLNPETGAEGVGSDFYIAHYPQSGRADSAKIDLRIVRQNGNVAVGLDTITPLYKLHVGGIISSNHNPIVGTTELTATTNDSLASTKFVKNVISATQIAIGTSGTDVNIAGNLNPAGAVTLNVPSASSTVRGVVTTGTQIFAGTKTFLNNPMANNASGGAFVAQDGAGSNLLFLGADKAAFGGGSADGLAFVYGSNSFHIATNAQRRVTVDGSGNMGVGITTPTSKVDISGSSGYNQLRLRTSYTPTATADANGNTGDFSWDANYFYIKTAAGWKRAALSTF
ncbi:glycosyl hydrolase family 28-related protein [Chitinophaga varians]|uniref:glycosyl hydrolase family 28-related protein n=1 Tax=Chitinophaga varians TaxID=2202339 RepID=UPI00165F2D96|nr:glycosyl hydrolase family 28-related protein [Chitinophaga varians]MBC9913193.1 hypothetical protein [Chitinophaga varians]